MTPKDDNRINATPAGEDYSLEDILAEYGGSLEQRLFRELDNRTVRPPAPPEPGPEPAPAPGPPPPAGAGRRPPPGR